MAGNEEYEAVHYGNYIQGTLTPCGKDQSLRVQKEEKKLFLSTLDGK